METIHASISSLGSSAPFACLAIFLIANVLVVWRLEVLSNKGVEGTVLGTLFMPFCSGLGNLIFAGVMARHPENGNDVVVNCLFNNITNLTLLIALPVLIWGMTKIPLKKGKNAMREHQIGRLSLSLNLIAALFFSLFLWLLASDGVLTSSDGFILIALFFFWQCFHIYDVKKTNLLKTKKYPKSLPFEVILLLIGAGFIFISTDWLVEWFQQLQKQPDSAIPSKLLGWGSGVLMVLPNALLAFYYAAQKRMDIVYTSQSGDAHICIPLSIGIYASFHPIVAGNFLRQSLLVLIALCLVHLLFVVILGRLPRLFAVTFLIAFGIFIWLGIA